MQIQLSNHQRLRITRNGDVQLVEDGRADLLLGMQDMLDARNSSGCVRMELSAATSPQMRAFLESEIAKSNQTMSIWLTDRCRIVGLLFACQRPRLFPNSKTNLGNHSRPRIRIWANEFLSRSPRATNCLYHPYQSYGPVVDFINAAADDPQCDRDQTNFVPHCER